MRDQFPRSNKIKDVTSYLYSLILIVNIMCLFHLGLCLVSIDELIWVFFCLLTGTTIDTSNELWVFKSVHFIYRLFIYVDIVWSILCEAIHQNIVVFFLFIYISYNLGTDSSHVAVPWRSSSVTSIRNCHHDTADYMQFVLQSM